MTKNHCSYWLFLMACSAMLFSNCLSSQTLAQWRGQDRKGIYPASARLTVWPEAGPKLLWSSDDIGDGYASPVCIDGKVYVCGAVDSTAFLFVFSADGRLLNKAPFGKEWMVNYIGCRNAPTVTAESIYLCTGLGSLVCLDRETLAVKWQVEGNKGFHNVLPLFGHAESPAVDGNLVFFVPGGRDTNVVALDRFTGKIVWICKGTGERPGYNSPLVIHLANRSLLVTFSAYTLMGIDTKTGQLLWTQAQDNVPPEKHGPGNGDTHSNTVWFEDGFIYYGAGDGNGAVKLKLAPDGSSIEQVWRNQSIDNYMGGFIKLGNFIYTCSDSKRSILTLDASTGLIADSLKCGVGTMISDGNVLYYYNQRGEMNLVRPEGKSPKAVSKFKVTRGTKEHFSHPVIDHGTLYLRHGKTLMAWEI